MSFPGTTSMHARQPWYLQALDGMRPSQTVAIGPVIHLYPFLPPALCAAEEARQQL